MRTNIQKEFTEWKAEREEGSEADKGKRADKKT